MEPKESSLWVERWRPEKLKDIVTTDKMLHFFDKIIKRGDITNYLFHGPFGTSKTTSALAIVKELETDYIHINSSINTSINDIRYTVQGFATSKSLYTDSKKIVILDEMDRLSSEAQDSLKGLIELTSERTRYIFITNHIERVHPALLSRTQKISFNMNENEKKELIKRFFKRVKEILQAEEVDYDSKVVAKFVANTYPDFRKIIGELQLYNDLNGNIDEGIFNLQDETITINLIEALKEKKIDVMRKLISNVDSTSFYTTMYIRMKEHIENSSIPTCIHILGEHTYRDGITINKEINLAECCLTLMEQIKWKK